MGTYWTKSGKYQSDYDTLKNKIPGQGKSNELNVEILRIVSNMYYDFYNNGNCNMVDMEYEDVEYPCPSCSGRGILPDYNEDDELQDCGDCYGSGVYTEEEEVSIKLTETMKEGLDFIRRNDRSFNRALGIIEAAITNPKLKGDKTLKRAYETIVDRAINRCLKYPEIIIK